MYRVVAIVTLFEVIACAPSPLRVTINCGPSERFACIDIFDVDCTSHRKYFNDSELVHCMITPRAKSSETQEESFDANSFCDLIHKAIPKAVRNGKFLVVDPDMDQAGFSDTQAPIAIAPPNGFIPKLGLPRLKKPKLKIPTINVPIMKIPVDRPLTAPRLGSPITFKTYRDSYEEPTSAEKMEQFKKGVQKMLHFVKVLGQVDQYLTERTRIVIDKLSKTFAD